MNLVRMILKMSRKNVLVGLFSSFGKSDIRKPATFHKLTTPQTFFMEISNKL